nr:hypothetical protein [uncultured Fusobacterium sp.]
MVDISKIDSVDVLKKNFENLKVAKEYFGPIANTPKEDKYYKYMISDIHAARNFLAKIK